MKDLLENMGDNFSAEEVRYFICVKVGSEVVVTVVFHLYLAFDIFMLT